MLWSSGKYFMKRYTMTFWPISLHIFIYKQLWMKYEPDETMGRGIMLWTGIYREMWLDLLFFYLNIKGYRTSITHSNYMKEIKSRLHQGNTKYILNMWYWYWRDGHINYNKSPTNQGNNIMRSIHGPQQPAKYNATLQR